jgi:ADP-heptose:LPS heptosyltransferase
VYGFGYRGRPGPQWRPEEHEVQRWQRLVCESLKLPYRTAEVGLKVPSVELPSDVTVVHPGAAFASRRWPIERYRAVVTGLLERGHDVVLTGGPQERPALTRVAGVTGVTQFSDLNLLELFALVAKARLVICGDTGVAHVASLYRTPSVLLFGPVAPSRWGPPDDGLHTVLWHGDGTGDPHGNVCDPALLQIQPTAVLHAVDQMAWRTRRVSPRGRDRHE